MQSELLSTWNWSRAFSITIEGIQICLHPVVELEKRIIKGGWLRRVRKVRPMASGVVLVFFLVHCTKPRLEASTNTDAIPVDMARGHVEVGEASWYGCALDGFEGLSTASGEVCSADTLTCAHRTLPLGTFVKVENLQTGHSCILRVNDRGPYIKGRILDVSPRGAELLGFAAQGLARVQLRVVDEAGNPVFSPVKDVGKTVAPCIQSLQACGMMGVGLSLFADSGAGQAFKRASALHRVKAASNANTWEIGDWSVDPFIVRRD